MDRLGHVIGWGRRSACDGGIRPLAAPTFVVLVLVGILAAIHVNDALGGSGSETCTVAFECNAGEPGGLGGEFDRPSGLAVSSEGNVYVADTNNNRVQEFNPSGGFIRAWGKNVVSGGGTGFEVCESVAECQAGETGGLGGELSEPWGIAVAPEAVYVVDHSNNRVQEFNPSGGFIRAWGKNVVSGGGTEFEVCEAAVECQAGEVGGLGGELSLPIGLAVSPTENVYVGDLGRVQEFNPSGGFIRAWGKNVVSGGGTEFEVCEVAAECQAGESGELGGELKSVPFGITIGSAEEVYVSDTFQDRIQVYTSTGGFLAAWGKGVLNGGEGTGVEVCTTAVKCKAGEPGGLGGEVSGPTGLGADATGDIYVADATNNRGQVFEASGTFLAAAGKNVVTGGSSGFEVCTSAPACQAGEVGGLGGELDNPHDLATDLSGDVYVADTENNRIQKAVYQTDTFLLAWGRNVGNEVPAPEPEPAPEPVSAPPPPTSSASPEIVEPGSLPAPHFAKTVNAEPVRGTVWIRKKGSRGFQVLTAGQQIPVGSILDTTHGRVRLTSAKTRSGTVETADFYAGAFRVLQPASGKPVTVLKLIDTVAQEHRRSRHATVSAHRSGWRRRHKGHHGHSSKNGLWGSGHGNYTTKGRYGSATVRGTIWFTQDRASGTFFEAKKHNVLVRDLRRHRTILLHAGQHYLARR